MAKVWFTWSTPLEEEVLPMLQNMPDNLLAYLEEIISESTEEITTWMQANAPWKDRTGDARRELHSEIQTASQHLVRLYMAHGDNINYAQYLEEMQAGRFSILLPAFEYWWPIMVQRVQAALAGFRPTVRRYAHRRIR